jgi:hypothetical protein
MNDPRRGPCPYQIRSYLASRRYGKAELYQWKISDYDDFTLIYT